MALLRAVSGVRRAWASSKSVCFAVSGPVVRHLLETHQPQPIPPENDAAIRERFRILLPLELANLG